MELTENGHFRLFAANGKWNWKTFLLAANGKENRSLFSLVGKR
jgi:hypothetical protein